MKSNKRGRQGGNKKEREKEGGVRLTQSWRQERELGWEDSKS